MDSHEEAKKAQERMAKDDKDHFVNSVPLRGELDGIRKAEIMRRVREVEDRNGRYFDEESEKLDRWAEDLKLSLEAEIKDLDQQIREAKKASQEAASLAENWSGRRK